MPRGFPSRVTLDEMPGAFVVLLVAAVDAPPCGAVGAEADEGHVDSA